MYVPAYKKCILLHLCVWYTKDDLSVPNLATIGTHIYRL